MLPAERLRIEVGQRWPRAELDAAMLETCAGRDASAELYLATAAGRGAPWAHEALERDVFLPVCERLARRHGTASAEEAMQQVREQLLVRREGLSTYSGDGALRAWVTVIAVRRLLSQRSASHDSLGAADDLANRDSEKLELSLLRARYASVFKQAFGRALESLERRERLVLRMHTVDGLSAEKIGAIFHVHRATATGWISNARAKLHERVTSEVQRAAGLSSDELHSIGRVLQRHTDFSLPRLLAGRAAEPAP